MGNRCFAAVIWIASVAATGCTPSVRVTPSPGPTDTGIRYYRPKPYLRIEPAGEVVSEGKTTTQKPSDEFVAITLEYLPDFSEEYSINVCSGFGSADVEIGLENGWNLTSINQDLDSQTDENLKAVADLAKAATGFIPSSKSADGAPAGSTQRFVVPATNVPIGYYESVLGRDACGRKRLYGWRYVGFLPFSPCPTDMCGSDHLSCNGVPSDLYGMVFEEGVMVFKPLDAIPRRADTKRRSVSTGQYVLPEAAHRQLGKLEQSVRNALVFEYGAESEVAARLSDTGMDVELTVRWKDASEEPDRQDWVPAVLEFHSVERALEAMGDPVPSFVRPESQGELPSPESSETAELPLSWK